MRNSVALRLAKFAANGGVEPEPQAGVENERQRHPRADQPMPPDADRVRALLVEASRSTVMATTTNSAKPAHIQPLAIPCMPSWRCLTSGRCDGVDAAVFAVDDVAFVGSSMRVGGMGHWLVRAPCRAEGRGDGPGQQAEDTDSAWPTGCGRKWKIRRVRIGSRSLEGCCKPLWPVPAVNKKTFAGRQRSRWWPR